MPFKFAVIIWHFPNIIKILNHIFIISFLTDDIGKGSPFQHVFQEVLPEYLTGKITPVPPFRQAKIHSTELQIHRSENGSSGLIKEGLSNPEFLTRPVSR
jgi:hypothetical protein